MMRLGKKQVLTIVKKVEFEGWTGNDMYRLTVELAKYFGPKGSMPEKLLILTTLV